MHHANYLYSLTYHLNNPCFVRVSQSRFEFPLRNNDYYVKVTTMAFPIWLRRTRAQHQIVCIQSTVVKHESHVRVQETLIRDWTLNSSTFFRKNISMLFHADSREVLVYVYALFTNYTSFLSVDLKMNCTMAPLDHESARSSALAMDALLWQQFMQNWWKKISAQ